jgi:hypothetical protein
MTEVFLAHDLLVEEGSLRHTRETAILAAWSDWGPLARGYHFSARTGRDTAFLDRGEQDLDLARRRRSRPPPPATLLKVTAGVDRMDAESQTVFRTSPSGGGRHPTEVYPCVRNVSGLEPGLYHYDGMAHELAWIGDPPDTADLAACGDQE